MRLTRRSTDHDPDMSDANDDDEFASDVDASGEDDDGDDDTGPIGKVKQAPRTRARNAPRNEDDDQSFASGTVSQDEDASGSEDDAEDWAKQDSDADAQAEVGNTNRCVFCGQDEEHDPSDTFEEFLTCSVCGDSAHTQCARGNDALDPDRETGAPWRCKDCTQHGLERTESKTSDYEERNSAPQIARELLPAARGGIQPNSHSVFNNLILDDDPMDGSRSLRKRKSSSGQDDHDALTPPRKRLKSTDGGEQVGEPSPDPLHGTPRGQVRATSARPAPVREGSQRPIRIRRSTVPSGARIITQSEDPRRLIVAIPISAAELTTIEAIALRKIKRRERDRIRRLKNSRKSAGETATYDDVPGPIPASTFPAVATTMYSNPFYAFPDREAGDEKGKPYGGILTEAEADTSRTYPNQAEREAFESARRRAEEERQKNAQAQQLGETTGRAASAGPPSKIKCIRFGRYEIDTWHAAPYPEEYSRNRVLYICEFCLKYMNSEYVARRHKKLKCPSRHPPGDEIYRNDAINPETQRPVTLSFFEVDGRRNPLYCQNLCLLAKLFLGSKTLYYDVEPFLFYVMTENDQFGCHFVGYFSKEKRGLGPPATLQPHSSFEKGEGYESSKSADMDSTTDPSVLSNPFNNVSCILVLPIHMRRGFGRVLIEFSYLLTRVERKTGSPEKPLSDMGLVSYRSYWRVTLCKLLLQYKNRHGECKPPSIASIAQETGMTPDDIVSTLEALRFLVRDPVTRTYALRLDYEFIEECVEKAERKATITIDPDKLGWTPYLMGRPTNYFALGEEANAPVHAKAQRAESPATEQINGAVDRPNTAPDDPGLSPKTMRKSPEATAQPKPTVPGLPLATSQSSRPATGYTTAANGMSGTTSRRLSIDTFHSSISSSNIPPTRYEVFPPLPGQGSSSNRRRAGRPFGARGTRRPGTANASRRSTISASAAGAAAEAPSGGASPTIPKRPRGRPRGSTNRSRLSQAVATTTVDDVQVPLSATRASRSRNAAATGLGVEGIDTLSGETENNFEHHDQSKDEQGAVSGADAAPPSTNELDQSQDSLALHDSSDFRNGEGQPTSTRDADDLIDPAISSLGPQIPAQPAAQTQDDGPAADLDGDDEDIDADGEADDSEPAAPLLTGDDSRDEDFQADGAEDDDDDEDEDEDAEGEEDD